MSGAPDVLDLSAKAPPPLEQAAKVLAKLHLNVAYPDEHFASLESMHEWATEALGEAQALLDRACAPAVAVSGVPSDSERLIWMHTNHASFGSTGRLVEIQGGEPFWDDATFVRVPCRHTYEWHCYDGADWRQAIDNAMNAAPCQAHKTTLCTNSRFAHDEQEQPVTQALMEARAELAALRAERDGLREALQMIARNTKQAPPLARAARSKIEWVYRTAAAAARSPDPNRPDAP